MQNSQCTMQNEEKDSELNCKSNSLQGRGEGNGNANAELKIRN